MSSKSGLSTSSPKVANPLTATDGFANATEAADGTLWLISDHHLYRQSTAKPSALKT
jgi:hypothetical protein